MYYSLDEDKDDDDDEDKDSNFGGKDGSLNSLPTMIKSWEKVNKETSDPDYSAVAGQFGALLKSMKKG